MSALLYHFTEQIEPGRIHQDGQFDATLLEAFYVLPETLYMIKHGLNRPVNQYQVVFCDKPIKNPACARDSAGRFINDADQIGLIFMEANVTVRLRFS